REETGRARRSQSTPPSDREERDGRQRRDREPREQRLPGAASFDRSPQGCAAGGAGHPQEQQRAELAEREADAVGRLPDERTGALAPPQPEPDQQRAAGGAQLERADTGHGNRHQADDEAEQEADREA